MVLRWNNNHRTQFENEKAVHWSEAYQARDFENKQVTWNNQPVTKFPAWSFMIVRDIKAFVLNLITWLNNLRIPSRVFLILAISGYGEIKKCSRTGEYTEVPITICDNLFRKSCGSKWSPFQPFILTLLWLVNARWCYTQNRQWYLKTITGETIPRDQTLQNLSWQNNPYLSQHVLAKFLTAICIAITYWKVLLLLEFRKSTY